MNRIDQMILEEAAKEAAIQINKLRGVSETIDLVEGKDFEIIQPKQVYMNQEQILMMFHKSTFQITEGDYAGKATQIEAIDLKTKMVVSRSGKQFSMASLKPYLKDIKSISLEEAKEIYRLYWNSEKTYHAADGEIINHNLGANVIYDVIRIWEGKDYVAGDRIEWSNVIEYCIERSIDFFDLIKNNKAVKL